MKMLGVITQMNDHEISRTNIANQRVHDRFSTPLVSVNNQGNIHAVIQVKRLNSDVIGNLKVLGIKIEYTNRDFKLITSWIPFDVVESLTKDNNILNISNTGKPYVKTGTFVTNLITL